MVCPKCGNEMPEGHLLCEKCGNEINIVPDFEPEIENSIDETLLNISDYIEPQKKEENKTDSGDLTSVTADILEEEFFKESRMGINMNKKLIPIICVASFALLALIVFIIFFAYRSYSSDYQIKEGKKYLADGNYTKALECIEKARSLKPDNLDLIYEEAAAHKEMGDFDSAREILIEGVDNRNMDYSTKEKFYSMLVELFSADEDYEALNQVLLKCEDEKIWEAFSEYMALPPNFSVPTGTYDMIMQLKIEGSTVGEIYYTDDGSIPSKTNGKQYITPIALTAGEYEIKAVFINKYNVESDISSEYYLMNLDTPTAPVIEPESGTYEKMIKITASAQEGYEIYYTCDGTDPTSEAGVKYTEPIDLPAGHYNYSFVSVSDSGVTSEVIKRSYLVDLKANVTPAMAVLAVMNNLVVNKAILDVNGTLLQDGGTLSLKNDTIIEISGYGYYYKLDEYVTDKNKNTLPTGLLYAVDIYTGDCYRLTIDNNANWGLIPLA